jgi:hypothetical protein
MAVGSTKTMSDLFSEGLSIINYFGHSSPNNIEFNLDNPQNYNNTGKYPLIIINGCNSGDLFTFDTLRAFSSGTLSEKFVFANQKGSIGYIASTHYGLPTQLNYFNTGFYSNLSKAMYGQPIGNVMKATMQSMCINYLNDYIAETHAEEITLHADPALRLNPHTKPDFIITDSLLNFNPSIVSVADQTMVITSKIVNIGKAVNDSLTIKVQHRLPNNNLVLVGTYRIKAVLYEDSVVTTLNLNPLVDKGYNEIIVSIDPDNIVSEITKTNNTVTKGFTILEDDIRPIWPYEYSIVNNATAPVFASTANPTNASKQYVMEMDTTMYFNSPFKISKLVTDSGGVIEFTPGINYTDSTVYYWRVGLGPAASNTSWRTSSFVYINSASTGFNQSYYFQYKKNQYSSISLDSNTRKFIFDDKERRLLIRTGLYPYYGWDQINVNVDDDQIDYYGCKYKALQFVVYDPLTLQPWKNVNNGGFGRFGSGTVCDQYSGTYRNFFEFPYDDTSYRRKAMQFFDSIPNGYYVSITNLGWIYNTNYFIDAWKSDTIRLGSGKSLWHKFHEMGMHRIDEFTRNLPFAFVFRKGDTLNFPVKQVVGSAANIQISETFYLPGKKVEGTIVTPWLGPAKSWDRLKWKENFRANATTSKRFDIIGRNVFGGESIITSVTNAQDTTISFINATTYPYLKMQLYNMDDQQAQTTDLRNWMLTGTQVPEGAIAPNMAFMFQDTVAINDTLRFKVAFKNVSTVNFDSIKLKLTITDKDGIAHIYDNLQNGARLRPVAAGDSVLIAYDIPMASYFGNNELKLEVNPGGDQPEQFLFNNCLFRNLVGINASICSGSSPTFVSGAHVIGNGYQWQVDVGNGFVDISDNALYTGTLTRTLLLNNVPSSMYGYKYRCEISNNGAVSYCPDFVLKFAMNWTGGESTAWENPANWSCNAIPDQYTDVNINTELIRYPVINSAAVCRSIRAKLGSRIIVNTGFSLLITGPPL